jgi:hypothetical protein
VGKKFDVKLAFLLDCTGSMTPQLEAVKSKIQELRHGIFAEFADVVGKCEIAFVGYKDYPMPPCVYQAFTTNVEQFEAALREIELYGNEDWAEDVLGGLQQVATLDWVADVKILFHIGDAGAHGSAYNGGQGDRYSDDRGYPEARPSPQAVLDDLAMRKVDYYFGRLNETTDQMTDAYKCMYDSVEAKNMEFTVVDFLDFTIDGFAEKILWAVRTSVVSVLQRYHNQKQQRKWGFIDDISYDCRS